MRIRSIRQAVSAAIVSALVLFAAPSIGEATTVLKLDLQSLVANSDRIVMGEIQSIESQRRDGEIVTDIEVKVLEEWTASDGTSDQIEIRQPGGRVGDTVTRVHGMPRYREGEKSVLFLDAHPRKATYSVTGLRQGKFHVAIGPDGATRFVVPRIGGVQLVDAPNDVESTGEGAPAGNLDSVDASDLRISEPSPVHETVTPLDAFRERVESAVGDEEDSR